MDPYLTTSDEGSTKRVPHLSAERREQRIVLEQAARETAEAATVRMRALMDAGRLLLSSLDYKISLRDLGPVLVPALADQSVIRLVDDGGWGRIAVTQTTPSGEEFARQLKERYPLDRDAIGGVHYVLRTGESLHYPEISEAVIAGALEDREYLRVLQGLGVHSFILAPLIARGQLLGSIGLFMVASGRSYGSADLAFAQDLATRIALALDNAHLYREAELEIEERRRHEIVAEEASRAKSRFLAVMSHELRTPLNAILGYRDLLDAEVAGPINAGQRKHLYRIQQSALHLLDLINRLLSFSRIEAGKEELNLELVDLAALARDAAALVEPLATEQGLVLLVDIPDGAVEVETDPGKIRQILLNLLSNAVKFTEQGEVEFRMLVEGEEISLLVRDTGAGIPRSEQQRIFEPFTQVDETRTRRKGGTGLGLSVSRELARLLGGEIDLKSVPDEGSTFTVRLPIRARIGTISLGS